MPEEMMPEEMMQGEMGGEETMRPEDMEIAKYKEGLQRILQSTNIAEIRSIAQELLQGSSESIGPEPSQPSLRDRLGENYGPEV